MITLKLRHFNNDGIIGYNCYINNVKLFEVVRGKHSWYYTFFSVEDNEYQDSFYCLTKEQALQSLFKKIEEWLQQEIEVVYE